MVNRSVSEDLEEFCEAVWVAREKGLDDRAGIEQMHADGHIDEAVLAKAVESGLVNFSDGRIRFTPEGEALARLVIRRHRLSDVLLFFALGMQSHEQRERITCQVEHTLQPELIDGICTLLGHPTHCPDGNPIPPGPCCAANAQQAPCVLRKLSTCEKGQTVEVRYIQPRHPERLQRLVSFGIVPGCRLTIEQTSPVFTVRLENGLLAMEADVAQDIHVILSAPVDSAAGSPPPGRRSRFRFWKGFGRRRAWIDHRK